MRKSFVLASVLTASLTLFGQQPGPRGRGPGGPEFGGPGGPGGPGRGFGMGEGRVVTGAPYAALRVLTFQQNLADGSSISRQENTQLYRDGQGRMRTEISRPSGTATQAAGSRNQNPRITITDPVAGVRRELDVTNKVSFESSMPKRGNPNGNRAPRTDAGTRPTPPANPNVKEEALGTQFMNGVNATGRRITRTIPAGTIGNSTTIQVIEERWMSDELKVPVMVKTIDPRSGTTTETLTGITRGEPDPTLFQAPTGYTVKTRQQGPGRGRGPRPAAPAASTQQ